MKFKENVPSNEILVDTSCQCEHHNLSASSRAPHLCKLMLPETVGLHSDNHISADSLLHSELDKCHYQPWMHTGFALGRYFHVSTRMNGCE